MKRICLLFLVFLGLLVSNLNAQERRITGTVTDAADGSSLPGVTVAVRGTTQGTITDINGRYEITVAEGATLVYSFIGMVSEEHVVGTASTINVALTADVATLQEIVVVGYGTRLKYELTGSISSVNAEDIAGNTMPSFETALQGRTAGVQISAGTGKLGQAIRTRVRGSSSISASNQPLYVIDGVPVVSQSLGTAGNEPTNPLAHLNPADIESVQVLKDASASAIYGSRASNGVILVTTRRGKEGKTRFTISSQYGFSEPANEIGFLNREQYIDLWRTAAINRYGEDDDWQSRLDNVFPFWRDTNNPDDITQGPDEDWEGHALRQGANKQFDISASGGTENTQYFTALSLFDQVAHINGNEFDRISGRLNLDQKANDWVSFGLNLNVSRSRNFRVSYDRAFASPLQMIALTPLDPAYDPNTGELNRNTLYENGLVVRKYSHFDTEVFKNFGNMFVSLELLPGLTFRSEAGMDLTFQQEVQYNGRLTNDGGPDGYGFERSVKSKLYNLENYFTYNTVFASELDLNLVVGNSLTQADFEFASMAGTGFPSDEFQRVASAAEISFASASGTGYRYTSFFARANLKYADRYLVTLSGRTDGSSRFGRDNRYGFFPAASIGWVVTNEDFLMDNMAISFLKPRISWGLTGNSEIDNFASRGLYDGSSYAGLAGLISTSIPSPDLKWETTTQVDFGIDFGFFNNRISGEIDYYEKKTEDLLLSVQVPASTGFTSVYKNVGNLENKGWEFLINTVNIDGEFKWNTNFNISFNENIVTNLDDQIIAVGIWRVMEDQPIGVFYTREYAGVNPENGDALFYLNEEGDETTTDIAEAANRIVGDPNPDFLGGFTNTFSYKGFDLSAMFQFVVGHDIYNHGAQWQASGLRWEDNQTVYFYENHWKEPGDETYYPQPRLYQSNGYGTSSIQIFDGSYLRLKEVTFGYTLPRRIVERVNVQTMRIFVRGYNLLTFTDYPGWDPESDSPDAGVSDQTRNIVQGWDFYTSPQARTITVGLNVNL